MIKESGKGPLVEVIILHRDGLKNIVNCLNSLKKSNYRNLLVSLVDQDSSDGTKPLVKQKYPWVHLIENKENYGFSKANNDVLKKSKAKYCILLNDDTEQEPNWISELVKLAEKEKDVAAIQPKVISLRNKKMFEHAGAAGGYIDIYGYPLCKGRVFDSIEEDLGQYDKKREIFWSCGVAMFLNMELLRRVGYLDEDFGAYAEEIDLSWRMNLAGYRQMYTPSAVIYHLGSATWGSKKYKTQKEYLIHRNHWILLFKNIQRKNWVRILSVKLVLESLTFLAFLLKAPQKSLATLKAASWILVHFPLVIRKNKEINKIRKITDDKLRMKLINTSVALGYFISGKKTFKDYEKYLNYDNYKESKI